MLMCIYNTNYLGFLLYGCEINGIKIGSINFIYLY